MTLQWCGFLLSFVQSKLKKLHRPNTKDMKMQPTNQNSKQRHLAGGLKSQLVNVLHMELVRLVLCKSLGAVLQSQSNCEV